MNTLKLWTHSKRRTEHGASLLELVLLLPLLIVLAFGVIDLGRLIHARLVVTNVSREGASLASRERDPSNLITMLQSSAKPFDLSNQGLIIVTKVGGADTTDPNDSHLVPYIISQAGVGALSIISSSISISGNNLNTALPRIIKYLVLDQNTGLSDISGVTVVEVFYHYRPITPLPNFIQGMFPSNGGIIIGSRSVFQTGGDRS
jgi:hypothetical protein